jgi:hypothetical protein
LFIFQFFIRKKVCQAFDDLDKMEKDLSFLFTNLSQNNLATALPLSSITSNQNDYVMKNFQILMAKNLAGMNAVNTSLDSFNTNSNHINNNNNNNSNNSSNSNNNNSNNVLSLPNTAALNIVNSHFSKIIDPEQENKEIEEFKW